MAQTIPPTKRRVDWDKEYLTEVKAQLADFQRQGFPPTFRGMYYSLVDLGILAKTEANYSALNKAAVRWREHGLVPISCFADNTRRIVKDFDDEFESPEDYIWRGIHHLENAHRNYRPPRWYKQKHYVEIWLEKDAAVGTFKSIVKAREVIVVPNRGHSSVTFINDNIQRLKQKQEEDKEIHILYFGDLDPSGEEMDKVYKRKLEEYGIYNVDFQRKAVTKEQWERFDLLNDPDPDTLAKLKKDPNRYKFMKKYQLKSESELFAIQLEAMQTPKVRGYLKTLVQSSVDQYFDEDIHKLVIAEHSPKKIGEIVYNEVYQLLDNLHGGR